MESDAQINPPRPTRLETPADLQSLAGRMTLESLEAALALPGSEAVLSALFREIRAPWVYRPEASQMAGLAG